MFTGQPWLGELLPQKFDTITPPQAEVDVHQTHTALDCLLVRGELLQGEGEETSEDLDPLFV